MLTATGDDGNSAGCHLLGNGLDQPARSLSFGIDRTSLVVQGRVQMERVQSFHQQQRGAAQGYQYVGCFVDAELRDMKTSPPGNSPCVFDLSTELVPATGCQLTTTSGTPTNRILHRLDECAEFCRGYGEQ